LLNFFGMSPNQTVRRIIFYPIWKISIYLTANIYHAIFIVIMILLVFVIYKKRERYKKYIFNYTAVAIVGILVVYIIYLFTSIYQFNPADKILTNGKRNFRIIILPIFGVDAGSYLTLDGKSAYFQETLCEQLKKNMPILPGGIEVEVVEYTAEYFPAFLYKPSTIEDFFLKNDEYEMAFWGYKLDTSFEKLLLKINPNKSNNDIEEDAADAEGISVIISTLFNELKTIPENKKSDFLSLLIVGILEQSFSDALIEEGQFGEALTQINKTISRIDVAFNNILSILPPSNRNLLKFYYAKYKKQFEIFRNKIKKAQLKYEGAYGILMHNLYYPFKNENAYMSWLNKHEGAANITRLNPLTSWPAYDSAFETFIENLLRSSREKNTSEKVKKYFDDLRNKHDDKFIINYYEALLYLIAKRDVDYIYIGQLIDKQEKMRPNEEVTKMQKDYLNMVQEALSENPNLFK
jgi:hypothetical protein